MPDADVIIAGGAVAGAALANALGSRGVRTVLIEKASREAHSNRGDLIHPPTLRLLDRWGVLQAFHQDGALPMTELAVSHATQGLLARFPLTPADDGPAGRTLAVPHDRIEALLYRCAVAWSSVEALTGTVTGLLSDENGRVAGVRYRPAGSRSGEAGGKPPRYATDTEITASAVIGCDGAQSQVRRWLGIAVEPHPYGHEQIIIGGRGETELPAALHWYLDNIGSLAVASRPRSAFRILFTLRLGQRGNLLKRPDPALKDYIVGRFPSLAPLQFAQDDAHLYRLAWHVSPRFWAPGAAIVGDAAHATHPAGATGMSLAITGAARLAELLAPALGSITSVDAALEAYDAERRPAAAAAVAANHTQALRIWQSDLYKDPEAYAQAVDPRATWGAGGAGWGADPAALLVGGTR